MSSILVISDTHLSHIFQPSKYTILARAIEAADQVIINGDFWEGHLSSFDRFVNSKWQNLFPLLKKKQAIYLYGNHDLEEFSDERRELFSVWQGDSYEVELGDKQFHFEHGNHIAPMPGGDYPSLPIVWLIKVDALMNGYNIRRPEPRSWLNARLKPYNDKMKRWVAEELEAPKILVAGHSHLQEYDPAQRYANSGIFKHRMAQYITIDEGVIHLHQEYY